MSKNKGQLDNFPDVELTAVVEVPLKLSFTDFDQWDWEDSFPDEFWDEDSNFVATKAEVFEWLTKEKGLEALRNRANEYIRDDGFDALDNSDEAEKLLTKGTKWTIRIPDLKLVFKP